VATQAWCALQGLQVKVRVRVRVRVRIRIRVRVREGLHKRQQYGKERV